MTPDPKMRGYKNGRFNFNVRGGRCNACKRDGITEIEMHFLPDVYVPCEVCKGRRYCPRLAVTTSAPAAVLLTPNFQVLALGCRLRKTRQFPHQSSFSRPT